jgi:hypothetical protein
MSRLVNIKRGLSSFAVWQLYLACITSVSDFGSQVWWKGQAQFKRPLQALQNTALRKILGVFKTAPTLPMEVKAMLAPPSIRLDNSLRNYAIRLQKLSSTHPVNQELHFSTTGPSDTPRKASQKTQLQRIQESIQGLVESDNLEEIQHFKFPPWEPKLLFQVVTSSLPKEEEAQNHLQQLQKESSDTI